MARIIVALDVAGADEALALVDRVGDAVGWYKVGAPLYTRAGVDIIRALKQRDKMVFLDLKFHDIPNTVGLSVAAAAEFGVDMLTVHASGGSTMMKAARAALGDDGPLLIGVTLLTSFSPVDVEEVWNKELISLRDEVVRLGNLAFDAGLHGVVTSPLEAEAFKRRHGPDFLVITPGIRLAGGKAGDQARTGTPAEAVRAGADFLVIGRPILEARDPTEVIARIDEEMLGAHAA